MRAALTALFIVVFAIGAAGIYVSDQKDLGSSSAQTPTSAPLQTVTMPTTGSRPDQSATSGSADASGPNGSSNAGSYTLADVAQHSNASSCWSAINGKVYDLTSWINQHPGGPQTILSICGIDGSNAFNDQHGGQGRPANELSGFYIGVLVQ